MIGVSIKALLDKCNDFSTSMLHSAAGQAVNRTHYEVTIEHYLLSCLGDARSDIPLILGRFELDAGKVAAGLNAALEEFSAGNTARPVFSPLLLELMETAWLISSVDLSLSSLRSGVMLLAFLRKPALYAQGNYTEQLARINRDQLLRDFATLVESSVENVAQAARTKEGGPALSGQAGESFVAKFCEDFTAKAKAGKVDPVFGRDAEIRMTVDILARRRKNNPILVGEPGVGKTAVLEGLALRIVQGDVPEVIQGVTLLSLDLGLLEAGAGMKGEFERRLKGVLDEIKSSEKPIILFIDEAHMLVGAGGAAGGSDAANLMKPALARGELRTCAATTWKEYKKYFEKDPALARRFQPVALDEPSPETTALILRGIRDSYETAHRVLIRDDALEASASLAHRYITGRFLPDKAIDLLDTACARVKVSLSAKPGVLEDKERAAQSAERELRGLQRDLRNGMEVDKERVTALEKRIAGLREEAATLEQAWQAEKKATEDFINCRSAMLAAADAAEAATPQPTVAPKTMTQSPPEAAGSTPGQPAGGPNAASQKPERDSAQAAQAVGEENAVESVPPAPALDPVLAFEQAKQRLNALRGKEEMLHVEVTPALVAQVVSDWTGIPVGRMAQEQAQTVRELDTLLGRRIKGQNISLQAISRTIQGSTAGLRSPNQPLGVFLLVGPSGVGKTETGLALADLLFGDERNAVTINMSEFQEKHTVSRLIGSPPGYVGYGEGGMLTEAVRRKPYSVVLLDEVEKAHLDVLNLFYQVFDKGVLTDGEGREISFKNTVIMLTSNLASDRIAALTGSGEEADLDTLIGAIRPTLSSYFRPALLARMTIVPFRNLAAEAMSEITDLKLRVLAKRLKENNGMVMTHTPSVVERIVARCSETETGARNIEYILAGTILPRLAQSILARMSESALPATVTLDVDESGAFSMDFS